jgi:hypothetical protein
MNDRTITLGELLDHPEVSHLLRPSDVESIALTMSTPGQTRKDPLYIRILSGVGAWFASIFIIVFLGMSNIITHETGAIICGVAFIAATVTLAKTCKSTFPSQLALAMAFAGNILLVFGLTQVFGHSSTHDAALLVLLLSHGVVCTTIYILYPSTVYRFFAPLAMAIIATIWISVEIKTFEMMHLLIAGETVLLGILLLHTRRTAFIQPLIHAAATMLPATIFFMNLTQGAMLDWHIWRAVPPNAMLPTSALLAVGMVYLLFRLVGGVKHYRQPWLIVAVVAILLLGLFTTPGILVAIGLLIAGYAFGDRALTALAYLFLPCFLLIFYYAMNVSLAHKSWMVAGSGLILLAVRWLLQQRASKEVAP